jgi:hypothetical protein
MTGLWRRWFVAATVGELVGFTVPALVGAVVLSRVADVPALIAAGFVEGAVLGFAQSAVIVGIVPGVRRRDWTVATGCAAAVAWALGMLPASIGGRVPDAVLWTVVALAAPVLLASLGTAQWLVLRPHRRHTIWWIGATAGAWLVGLGVFIAISSPLWQPGQPPGLIALIGVGAGAAMAATTAALTGLAVRRLARTDQRPVPQGPAALPARTRPADV